MGRGPVPAVAGRVRGVSVHVQDVERVRVVIIDRPDRRNAIDRTVYAGLLDAFDGAAASDGIGAVVLTAAGREVFTAGADRDELAAVAAGDRTFSRAANRFLETVRTFPKPLVVAVNGMAVGMGTTLLGHADLAFAAESARFRTPFTAMGLSTELGSSRLLPELVGWQRAAWLLLSSEWIDARTAAAWGLVLEVVPDGKLRERAVGAAQAIADRPLASVTAVKRTMQAWRYPDVSAALEVETAAFRPLLRGAVGGDR